VYLVQINRKGELDLAYVKIYGDNTKGVVEAAIKKFGQKVAKEGILREIKNREYYLSPSEKRRAKKNAAKKRFMKNLKKRRAREERLDNIKFIRKSRNRAN